MFETAPRYEPTTQIKHRRKSLYSWFVSSTRLDYTVDGNTYVASDPPIHPSLKQQILDQIAVLERELEALRALAQQLPD